MAKTAVVVLGMHRSGTSAFARVISLLGAQLPQHLLEAGPENEKGFWESPLVAAVNDELLAQLGSSWSSCLALAPLPASAAEGWVGTFEQVLADEYGDAEVIVLKDPRICRLLPWWRRALEHRGYRVKCVVPIRNPLEVARSLEARNGISPAHGVLIWARYVVDAIQNSSGMARMPVTYEALLGDAVGTAHALRQWLGLEVAAGDEVPEATIFGFVEGRLRRQHSTWNELYDDAAVPVVVKEVARAVQGWHVDPDPAVESRVAALVQTLADAEAVFGPAVTSHVSMIAQLRDDAARLRETLAGRDVQITARDVQITARDVQIVAREAQLAAANRRAESLTGELAGCMHVNGELRAAISQYQTDLEIMHASTSWRITEPLRWAGWRVRRAAEMLHAKEPTAAEPTAAPAEEPATALSGPLASEWGGEVWEIVKRHDSTGRVLDQRLPEARVRLAPRPDLAGAEAVCDVVIPVYNAPDNVRSCVRSLLAWTKSSLIGRVILADDASGPYTRRLLGELAAQPKVSVLAREANVGYLRNVNAAVATTTADFVLLLNSDCYVGPNTLERLISAMLADDRIGLVSPLSNNAPPLSLPMLPGFSHVSMERFLSAEGRGAVYPACTIVGNCLLVRRKCWEEVGPFDESWGIGYGEETDYQFRAASKGWRAAVAADAYAYHQGHGSFGRNEEADELRATNLQRFLERWGREYREELEQRYVDPVADWVTTLLAAPAIPKLDVDVLFILPAVSQAIGGTTVVMELAEKLLVRGITAAVAVAGGGAIRLKEHFPNDILKLPGDDEEALTRVQAKYVVATHWSTVELIERLASRSGAKAIYLIQGFEPIFAGAEGFDEALHSYQRLPHLVAISGWLAQRVEQFAGRRPRRLVFGPNVDLFHPGDPATEAAVPTVGMALRGSIEKGDHVLRQIVHSLTAWPARACQVRVLDTQGSIILRSADNLEVVRGPLGRRELAEFLKGIDVWVDASLHEGYGRLPVEAMACGAALVATYAGGNDEYAGGAGVKRLHIAADGNHFVHAVQEWIEDPAALRAAKESALARARAWTFDDGVTGFAALLHELGN